MYRHNLGIVILLLPAVQNVVWAGPAQDVADGIRIEATRPSESHEGRPLPLATHWNSGSERMSRGWEPARQIEMIEQGHHLLPWFAYPGEETGKSFAGYYEGPLKKARQLRLPLVLVSTQ
jgi:hypothetical protein